MELPVKGTVGVLGGSALDVEKILGAPRSGAATPDAVEVRADLFETPAEALRALDRVRGSFPAIFTVRLPGHGGKYEGSETARLSLYRKALGRGAALVDAEWDSECAFTLAREGAPLIASHHDFQATPDAGELERLSASMVALGPRLLKLVTTARSAADGLRILEWTGASSDPPRVGFAMGEMGLPSRVLSMSRGAPFTYAALGAAVAPGQPSVRDLKTLYRAGKLGRKTVVLGVAGNPVSHSLSPHIHNPALEARGIDAVYLPFLLDRLEDVVPCLDPLRMGGLSVTIPFKEDALRLADAADPQARSAGAANTLVIERAAGGRRTTTAYNTDFEGVLGPLRRRGVAIEGLTVAILGNGGAARGAARALAGAGASVKLYARSLERARPVAARLQVSCAPLDALEAGSHRLIINATPLGLHAGDPSPVPATVFDARTIAFDMVYDPPDTPFLEGAKAAGAATIPGREMLIAQALVQFRLFTGAEATAEEMEASFVEAQRARRDP